MAWDEGLQTLYYFPSVTESFEKLLNSYFHQTPLELSTLQDASQNYEHFVAQAVLFQTEVEKSPLLTKLISVSKFSHSYDYIVQHKQLIQESSLLLSEFTKEVAVKQKHSTLIVFENNMELRPTGGFLGSYAELTFEIGAPITLNVEDIYVPDGQLTGHVDPPLPIQEAFQQGFWKLRDANWHPDFSESSNRIDWFFSQVAHTHDATVAVTFSSIQQLLDITGDIWVPDFNTTVNTQNIYPILQRTDDEQFFPGSTKKKDTLRAFTSQLLMKIPETIAQHPQEFVSYLFTQFEQKHILITTNNQKLQQYLDAHNWSGKLTPPLCTSAGCEHDYFSIFDANLGVNKANCCVKRSITAQKNIQDDNQVHTQYEIMYDNKQADKEYEAVTGNYKAFVRLYFPQNTSIKQLVINGQNYTQFIIENTRLHYLHPITSQGYSLQQVAGLTELGMWIVVPQGQSTQINFETDSQLIANTPYRIDVQKQPGTFDFFNVFDISINKKTILKGFLRKDTILLID